MTLIAVILMLAAGQGLLRALLGDWPVTVIGPLAAAGLSALLGAVVIGLATTYVAITGMPTRLWPVIAPVILVVSTVGLLPCSVAARLRIHRRETGSRNSYGVAQIADAAVVAVVAVIGIVMLWGVQHASVRTLDEWAIWAVRGRTLSLAGKLDPVVFIGTSANYQHLDYPLLVPSLISWGDGLHGGLDDTTAHVLLIGLVLAMLATVGWAVNRMGGAVAGVASILLIVGTPGLVSRFATLLTADATLVALSISLLCTLALWLSVRDDRLLWIAAVLGAGAVSTKVEGTLFVFSMYLAAAACVCRETGRLKRLALAFGVVALSAAPWFAWTRLHNLNSDQINSATLNPHHILAVLRYCPQAARAVVDFWPGHGRLLVLVAVGAAALAASIAADRRIVLFVTVAWALMTVGIWAQYVISAGQGPAGADHVAGLRAHFASSAPRVLLVLAITMMLAIPLFAGIALSGTRPGPHPSRDPADRGSETP